MKVASSQRQAAVEAAHSLLSNRDKGQRKTKFVPPLVKSVNWKDIDQSFLIGIASSVVGEDKARSLSPDAVNNIVFGSYSAIDLRFVLEEIGFSDAPIPTKKKALIKNICSIYLDDSHFLCSSMEDEHVKLSCQGQSQLCEGVSTLSSGSKSDSCHAFADNPLRLGLSSCTVPNDHLDFVGTAVTNAGIEDDENGDNVIVTELISHSEDM